MINETILTHIKTRSPKIHSITNTITINDCANIILAAGGHATMASAPEEAAEMTSRCDGLVLNLGAISSLEAMLAAGKEANRLGHPVVFDPVAAGATGLRRKASLQLLQELRFSAIRGNASEIHALALLSSKKEEISQISGSFVDVSKENAMQEKNLDICLKDARILNSHTNAIIVISGIEDLIVSRDTYKVLKGGSPLSARITGSGCMLTELICLCMASSPEAPFEAVCTAVGWMNLCAQKAARKTQAADGGTMTFRMYLIDEISKSFINAVPGL